MTVRKTEGRFKKLNSLKSKFITQPFFKSVNYVI
jgi:hypothetical protein